MSSVFEIFGSNTIHTPADTTNGKSGRGNYTVNPVKLAQLNKIEVTLLP